MYRMDPPSRGATDLRDERRASSRGRSNLDRQAPPIKNAGQLCS